MPGPYRFEYSYETLSRISGWPRDRIAQDVTRGLDLGNISDVSIWLAANGPRELRAQIYNAARTGKQKKLSGAELKLLAEDVFGPDDDKRRARGKKISRTKKRLLKSAS